MFTLTEKQSEKLQKKYAKKTEQLLKGNGIFGLDRSKCLKHFNVDNTTFHEPMCSVIQVQGDKALVDAQFHDGTILNSVRQAWIPTSDVKAKPSFFIIFSYCLFNLLKTPLHLFHGRKQEIWTLLSVESEGRYWHSEHEITCAKCSASRKQKYSHTKLGSIKTQGFEDFGSTKEQVIEKTSKWNFDNNGGRTRKDKKDK